MICDDISQYAIFTTCTIDGLNVLIDGLNINQQFLVDAIGIYKKSSDSLSITQLVDCPEAVEYAEMIHVLLWQKVIPLLSAISIGNIALKIARNIFDEV